MNILDLKRKAQGFHLRGGDDSSPWNSYNSSGNPYATDADGNRQYQYQMDAGGTPLTLGNGDSSSNNRMALNDLYAPAAQRESELSQKAELDKWNSYSPEKQQRIQAYFNAGWSPMSTFDDQGNALSGEPGRFGSGGDLFSAISNAPPIFKAGAALVGAGAFGAFDPSSAATQGGASTLTGGSEGFGGLDAIGQSTAPQGFGTSAVTDTQLANAVGTGTGVTEASWMDKLAGAYPGLVSGAKTVGTGLDYAQKGLGLYSLYNKFNNANNNSSVANQIQGNSNSIAGNDNAIADQIKGINEQISKIPTVDSLYGVDGAYAKNLYKQLAAKDAAAGRNSQYGQRLEDFNGKLATVAGDYANKYAQQVGSLNNSISGLYNSRTNASTALTNNAKAIADLNNNSNINKAQTLSSLYNEYKNSGISDALKNWFSSDSEG